MGSIFLMDMHDLELPICKNIQQFQPMMDSCISSFWNNIMLSKSYDILGSHHSARSKQ